MRNILSLLQSCQEKVQALEKMIPVSQHKRRLDEIDEIVSKDTNLWNDQRAAANLMKERQRLAEQLEKLSRFQEQTAFNTEYAQLLGNGEVDALYDDVEALYLEMVDMEFKQMMMLELWPGNCAWMKGLF